MTCGDDEAFIEEFQTIVVEDRDGKIVIIANGLKLVGITIGKIGTAVD